MVNPENLTSVVKWHAPWLGSCHELHPCPGLYFVSRVKSSQFRNWSILYLELTGWSNYFSWRNWAYKLAAFILHGCTWKGSGTRINDLKGGGGFRAANLAKYKKVVMTLGVRIRPYNHGLAHCEIKECGRCWLNLIITTCGRADIFTTYIFTCQKNYNIYHIMPFININKVISVSCLLKLFKSLI